MNLLNNEITVSKYLAYQSLMNGKVYITNVISGHGIIVNNGIFSIIKYLENKKITEEKIKKILRTKTSDVRYFFDKFIEKSIFINNTNLKFYKYYEQVLFVGLEIDNGNIEKYEHFVVLGNADKIITTQESIGYIKEINKNTIYIQKEEEYLNENPKKTHSNWFKEILLVKILENVEKNKTIVVIMSGGHPLMEIRHLNIDITPELSIRDIDYRFITSVSFIDKIFIYNFFHENPIDGLRIFNVKKIYEGIVFKRDIQTLITLVGYEKGINFIYNNGYNNSSKKYLREELIKLKLCLLKFLDISTEIYLISSDFRKKFTIENIPDMVDFWVPGRVTLFIDKTK